MGTENQLGYLLLVDEDDDGRLDARVEDADQLVPLVVLFAHVHNLKKQANKFLLKSYRR
jgi:hypothetical protein